MRESETREIAGVDVTTAQLPALRGSRLRFRLARLVGPALAALRGRTTVADLLKADVGDVAQALVALVGQIDDAAHDQLMLEILVCTSVVKGVGAGKLKIELTSQKWIDEAFDGDVDALWSTVKFALEVNVRSLTRLFPKSAAGEQPAATPSS